MEFLSTSNPAFAIYVYSTIALALNLMGLWAYSGAVRGKTKVTPNAEDGRGKSTVSETEPPEVARVLRAHRNAEANIVPFLFLALPYVMIGASPRGACVLFGGFVAFRYFHSLAYLRSWQPWRSLAFGGGVLCMLGVIVQLVRYVGCACAACPMHH